MCNSGSNVQNQAGMYKADKYVKVRQLFASQAIMWKLGNYVEVWHMQVW